MDTLQKLIEHHSIPPALLSLPPHLRAPRPDDTPGVSITARVDRATPIIPVFTSRPRPLSAHLRTKGMNARPITWPTVPKGLDRVRVCLHANNSEEDVDRLATAMVEWARGEMAAAAAAAAGRGREHGQGRDAQVVEVKPEPRQAGLALQSKL